MAETWFRVTETQFTDGSVRLFVERLTVVKETPKGVWLRSQYGWTDRFVLRDARKRYACPTEEEAMESFRARKRRQRLILRAQLDRVERALAALPSGAPTEEESR